jgi:hypothetical protein
MTSPTQVREGFGCRASLWLQAPALNGEPTAAIGRLEVTTQAGATAFLKDLTEECRHEGARWVLAPLDGDTWHTYRLAVEGSQRPFFAMEPPAHPVMQAALLEAGFSPQLHYLSAEVPSSADRTPRLGSTRMSVRPLNLQDAEGELERMYRIASVAFQRAPLFTPITFEGFAALYRPALAKVMPELVLFAEDENGEAIGFLFGFPDWAAGTASPRAAILKTYATLKPGAGALLADAFHVRARQLGFATVVHALMHEDNRSRRHSHLLGGSPFRRYALFARSTRA